MSRKEKDLRKFGFTVGGAALVFGGLLFWLHKDSFLFFVVLGSILMLLGWMKPRILNPLQVLWMGVGHALGWCMTRVILSVLFYGVLTPIGLIARRFGKSFLDLKMDRTPNSYWINRTSKVFEKVDYERQF